MAGGGDHEQEFFLLPHFVMGSHFKLNLIGKPFAQEGMDDKYYQALRYVGVAGRLVDAAGPFADILCSMAEDFFQSNPNDQVEEGATNEADE